MLDKPCATCKYSQKLSERSTTLLCMHPEVNRRKNHTQPTGTPTHQERAKTSGFAACGQRGELWTAK